MNWGIEDQLLFLLTAAVSGILLSFVYDILRAKRKTFGGGAFLINLEDIIFILFAGVVFLYVTYKYNGGAVRAAGFFALIFGGTLYFAVFKNKMVGVICFVIRLIQRFARALLYPVKTVFCGICRTIKRPVRIAAWYTGNVFLGFKSRARSLWWRIKQKLKILRLFY